MRKIKGSSNYLRNQVRGNLAKAALSMFIFAVALTGLMLWVITRLQWGIFEAIALILLLVPIVASYFYLRKYHLYNGGWHGEKQVAKLLKRKLSDDYCLINDLYLRDGGGDIDHVVLGPNGVLCWKPRTGAATSSATVTCGSGRETQLLQAAQAAKSNDNAAKSKTHNRKLPQPCEHFGLKV